MSDDIGMWSHYNRRRDREQREALVKNLGTELWVQIYAAEYAALRRVSDPVDQAKAVQLARKAAYTSVRDFFKDDASMSTCESLAEAALDANSLMRRVDEDAS